MAASWILAGCCVPKKIVGPCGARHNVTGRSHGREGDEHRSRIKTAESMMEQGGLEERTLGSLGSWACWELPCCLTPPVAFGQ
jgi:hypothetical protein